MQHGNLILDGGKAGFEALDGLRGERYFWQKNEHAFAGVEATLGGLEIHLGFA